MTYQPARRYWVFQGYKTAIFLALALVVAGFCLWWVRRRRLSRVALTVQVAKAAEDVGARRSPTGSLPADTAPDVLARYEGVPLRASELSFEG